MQVFVSYRRKTWPFTHRLADALGDRIRGDVFVDLDGVDESIFERSILRNLHESDVFLLIVSEHTFDPNRIHQERDWVRREIAEALRLKLPIVLALVDGIQLPPASDLPDDIRDIRSRQGIEFYPRFFDAGVEELAAFIEEIGPRRVRWGRILALVATVAVLIGAGLFVLPGLLSLGQPEEETVEAVEAGWVPLQGGSVFLGTGPGLETSCSIGVEPFQIQLTEVTNEAYKACVDAGLCAVPESIWPPGAEGRSYPDALAQYPVYAISWADADAYCQFIGARLPTEAEWVFAARGGTEQDYPWPGGFDINKANTFESGVSNAVDVTSYPQGRSDSGLYHMVGNVSEWIDGSQKVACDPTQGTGGPITKGGSFLDAAENASLWMRFQNEEGDTQPLAGFRCARD